MFILLLFGEEKSFPIGVKILGGAVQEEKPLEGTWKCLYFISVSNSFNSFIDFINFFKDDFFGKNCF